MLRFSLWIFSWNTDASHVQNLIIRMEVSKYLINLEVVVTGGEGCWVIIIPKVSSRLWLILCFWMIRYWRCITPDFTWCDGCLWSNLNRYPSPHKLQNIIHGCSGVPGGAEGTDDGHSCKHEKTWKIGLKMSFQKCLKTMTSAETTSLTKRLPAEVLERIFRHLPPPSLKNVLQVFWIDVRTLLGSYGQAEFGGLEKSLCMKSGDV